MTGSRSSRRADILAEAADLFARRGFAAVGVSDIGERVGITGGAIYRHFENKDAVLQTLLAGTVEAWLAAAHEVSSTPPSERITHMVEQAVQLVMDRPGELATFVRERHRADKATARLLAGRERELASLWRAALIGARPDLTDLDDELRQRAINGVMSSLAHRPAPLLQPRFRALVTDGLVSLAACAPGRFDGVDVLETWTAPRSRRHEILTAAAALFRQHGYHGVGIDEIGDAAGISGPAVYEHFGSKADILVDLYDLAGSLVVAGNLHALRDASSPDDALTRITRSIVQITFEWTDAMIVTAQEGHALPDADRSRLARRRHEIYEAWITVMRALRPDLSPPEAKALVLAILPMVGQVAVRARPAVLSVDATVDAVRAFLLGSERVRSTKEKT